MRTAEQAVFFYPEVTPLPYGGSGILAKNPVAWYNSDTKYWRT